MSIFRSDEKKEGESGGLKEEEVHGVQDTIFIIIPFFAWHAMFDRNCTSKEMETATETVKMLDDGCSLSHFIF